MHIRAQITIRLSLRGCDLRMWAVDSVAAIPSAVGARGSCGVRQHLSLASPAIVGELRVRPDADSVVPAAPACGTPVDGASVFTKS